MTVVSLLAVLFAGLVSLSLSTVAVLVTPAPRPRSCSP